MAASTKGALFFGKVVDLVTPVKNTIRVLSPKLTLNSRFNVYLKDNLEMFAHDPENKCKAGDHVLIRLLPEPMSLLVKYELEKIVYNVGNLIDPVTGKKGFYKKSVEELEFLGEVLNATPKYKSAGQKSAIGGKPVS